MTVFHTDSDGIPEETNWYAVYTRVSSKKQAGEDKTSLASQRSDCIERGEGIPGGKLYRVYEDVLTGDDDLRPGLVEMIEDARNGGVKVLIVSSVDRLTRLGFIDHRILERIQHHGLHLISVKEGEDLVILLIHAAIARKEKETTLSRTTDAKVALAREGKVPHGRVPYGYRVGKDRRPEIDPDAAVVVQRIYRERVAESLTGPQLALLLTEAGVPPPKGSKEWTKEMIYRILKCKTYANGLWPYRNYRGSRRDQSPAVYDQTGPEIIEIPVPVLIDGETWEAAQVSKEAGWDRSRRRTLRVYLLQYLVYCDVCGNRYRVHSDGKVGNGEETTGTGAQGRGPRRVYYCFTCQDRPRIPAEDLEGPVWREVRITVSDPALLGSGTEMLDRAADRDLAEKLKEGKKELRELDQKHRRLLGLVRKGLLTGEDMEQQVKQIADLRAIWKRRVAEFQAKEAAGNGQQELLASLMQ